MTPLPYGASQLSLANKKTKGGDMIDRRRMLTSVGLSLVALTSKVGAQPASKPVTLVVPYAAGGGTDTVARLITRRTEPHVKLH